MTLKRNTARNIANTINSTSDANQPKTSAIAVKNKTHRQIFTIFKIKSAHAHALMGVVKAEKIQNNT